VDISWLGHACIRLRTSAAMVVMDPVDRESGYDMGRPTADIVTLSSTNASHANTRGVRGEFTTLDAPGEYEIRGVQLMGVATRPPRVEGEPLGGRNTIFMVEAEELRVAHLGRLGWRLASDQAEQLGEVDVLIIPIGGAPVLDAAEAARLIREIDPKVVIPVHYTPDENDLPPQDFIKAMGATPEAPTNRASIQRRALGENTRLVVLQPRG
jgi:L-ascorbate metabolism protein UlaG (beta-lactamase superfamily)